MWGGGFLRQASETSNHNHDLLRKTKDKKVSQISFTRAHGRLAEKHMTESERREFLSSLKEVSRRDLKKKLILLTVTTLVILALAILMLN